MLRARAAYAIPLVIARERAARPGRPRIPEPMAMIGAESVADYHAAGAEDGLQAALHELQARSMSRLLRRGGTVLDLGVGSGRLAARLARHRPDARIVGVELGQEMLATAQRLLATEGLDQRVTVVRGDITEFAASVPDEVALIGCQSALHHLPGRGELDRCLAQIATVRERSGCGVFIFDFARMRDPRSFPALSRLPVGADPGRPVIVDGIASEAAAWTFAELREALDRAGLGDLTGARTRPLRWLQAHWGPRGDDQPGAGAEGHAREWRPLPLSRSVRIDCAIHARSLPGLP
jgi:SAM-dependent methyltransferase